MLDLDACWTTQAIAVADVETTGLDTATCGVVSVACVRFEGGKVAEQFYSLVNPGMPIPAESTTIHGVYDEMVKDSPTFESLSSELASVSCGAIACGYNALRFDAPVFRRFAAHAFDYPLWNGSLWLDPLVVVRKVDKYQRSKRLVDACARRGIELGDAHNALADCLATGRLLFEMLKRGEIKPCPARVLLEYIAKTAIEQEKDFQQYRERMASRGL